MNESKLPTEAQRAAVKWVRQELYPGFYRDNPNASTNANVLSRVETQAFIAGFDAANRAEQPKCATCGGSGVIDVGDPDGQSRVLEAADCPACIPQQANSAVQLDADELFAIRAFIDDELESLEDDDTLTPQYVAGWQKLAKNPGIPKNRVQAVSVAKRKDDLPSAAVVLCAEYRCIKPATKTIYAEFTNFAIPYDACDEHYAHAGTRSYMTFRIKDGLLVGYRDGIITQVTDKRLRTV